MNAPNYRPRSVHVNAFRWLTRHYEPDVAQEIFFIFEGLRFSEDETLTFFRSIKDAQMFLREFRASSDKTAFLKAFATQCGIRTQPREREEHRPWFARLASAFRGILS